MSEKTVINPAALEPLFSPWDEPIRHRVKPDKSGESAKIINGRRPSPIAIAQNLRWGVKEWREALYAGASDTTRELLNHWFNRSHRGRTTGGEEFEFHYYFCQREAIETLIYLKEVRALTCFSDIVANFGGPNAEIQALGITEEEDMWPRYAFKVATGAGKTKIMSLAIVWSYFHHLRESNSPLTRHFAVIAPNLTVYERLKEDFGDGKVFDADPLIPVEWRGDWNLSIVLQDEATGAATGGTLYLTNIHRLYDQEKRRKNKDAETYDWAGPSVSQAKALDTGAALRDRITSHPGVMLLNDEAHHVWDPDSAWSAAIRYLHETLLSRTGHGLVAQLDFSATPKDDKGLPFKHIVCDTPLGEAVDAGIVKTPIIGRAEKGLQPGADENAGYRFDQQLRLGYERWRLSKEEWEKIGTVRTTRQPHVPVEYLVLLVDLAADETVLLPGPLGHEPIAPIEALIHLDDGLSFDSYNAFHCSPPPHGGRHPLCGQRLTVSKTYFYINIVVLAYIYCMTAMLIYLCHVVRLMPTITIYLTNDLYDKVRDAPSKTVRAALEYYFKSDNTDEPSREAEDAQQQTKDLQKTRARVPHH